MQRNCEIEVSHPPVLQPSFRSNEAPTHLVAPEQAQTVRSTPRLPTPVLRTTAHQHAEEVAPGGGFSRERFAGNRGSDPLDLDPDLVERALALSGAPTKRAAVTAALQGVHRAAGVK